MNKTILIHPADRSADHECDLCGMIPNGQILTIGEGMQLCPDCMIDADPH